ncbi:MAG: GrpB family protein [Chitinophagales bacterium]
MKKITIEEYNPDWKLQFEALKACIARPMKGLFLAIEHVGSTSVEGLAAKPIIDMDIIIAEEGEVLQQMIGKLAEMGYIHRGDLGIEGRHAFKRQSDSVPFCNFNQTWQDHHLYVCKKGIPSLQNHLLLRDYLRTHPESVIEYGELKKQLATKYPYGIDSYIEGKTAFIVDILQKQGFSERVAKDIEEQNRNKSD